MCRSIVVSRSYLSWGALLALWVGAGAAFGAPALRHTEDVRGDMALIGNTLGHACAYTSGGGGQPTPAPVVGTVGSCGSNYKDTGIDILWRSEEPGAGQASADSSITVGNARSTAILNLPAGASVTYARLYWAAAIGAGATDTDVTLDRPGGFSAAITADHSATVTGYYQSTAEVTALVQAQGVGAYRVSGVSMLDPVGDSNETSFAAWSLVVFYSLSGAPPRNLALFDGLDLVTSSQSASATVSGFVVPNAGYSAKLGVIAYEGDGWITGDALEFNGVTLTDASNPSDNFFNSTRSDLGARVSVVGDLPQLTGGRGSMSGLDLDVVDVTAQLGAGDTDATTKATSTQDTYLIGAFVTSISTLRPIFTETVKSYVDLNGGLIAAGDAIEYTLSTRNTGSDTAVDTLLDDPLPAGVTYVPGSLEVIQGANAGAKTDASGDDQADYDSTSRTVHFRIGTGASATQGGTVTTSDPDIVVRFRVTVDAGATGVIDNQGAVTATGQIGGQVQSFPSSSSGSNGLPTPIVIAPDTTIVSGPPASTTATDATFDFGSNTAGVTYECDLDGAGYTACADPLSLTGLSEGEHTLSVRAVIGGVADPTPTSQTWTVDQTEPTTTIVSGPPSLSASPDAPFDFSSNETDVTYECSLDAEVYAPCTDPVTFTGLGEGPHTLAVRARDAAGNVDSTLAAWAWTVDTTAPETTLDSHPPALTNSVLASFTYSSEAGATFECKLDLEAFDACPASYLVSEGTHTFQVRAKDLAGNVDASPASWTWTVDATAPETSIDSGPTGLVSSTSASFEFSSPDATATFECQLDSGALASCTSPISYSDLTEGPHTITVQATDAAGNVDASPATRTWTVDTTAPETSIDSGPSGLTNATTASFEFSSLDATATFECQLDTGAFASCTSPVDYSDLTDGPHTVTVRAKDAAGNVDPSPATRTWTVDATAPDTSIDSGPTGLTSATTASFGFSSADATATFECQLDTDAFAACTSPVSYSDLLDGSHTVTVRAKDAAGNVDASPATRTWTVDATAPDTSIDSGPTGLTNATTASFDFSSTDATATFECQLDTGAFASCTSPVSYSGLSDGSHTVTVRAKDAAGNVDASPATRSWTVDATAPDTSIDSGPTGLTNVTTASFDFSSADATATFECKLDTDAFAACTSPVDYSALTDGPHTVTVRAKDAAGNVDASPATRTWTVDATAPDTSIDSGPTGLTNVTTASFDFSSGDATATFECQLDTDAFAACTSPVSYSGLTDGSHTVTVRAKDAAGNVDASPATRTWSVDATAPDTSIDSGPTGLVSSTSASFDFSSADATATFECKLDTDAFAACTSPVDYSDLTDGPHTVAVRAKDAAGNLDASPATRSWTVDATAPDTSIDSGPTGLTNVTTASFDFSSLDATATFECKLDTDAFAACTSPVDYSALTDGPHTVTVRAKDAAGNVDASPATRTWTVDATAPDTSIDSGPTGLTNVTTASFDFSSTDATATFECQLDTDAFASCTSPVSYSDLTDGSHTVTVRAKDAAGNVDASPATRTWTVDATAPDTSIDSGPTGLTNVTTASFDFSSTDATATFECQLDSGAFATCTSPVSYSGLTDGSHTVTVRAKDAAGNVDASPATRTWTVDATAPDTSIDSGPTGLVSSTSASFDFSSADATATFECQLDTDAFAACTSPVTYSGLSDGSHTVTVRAKDAAGNVDPSPATRTWTVDATAPDTSIDSGPTGLVSSTSASFDFSSPDGAATFECQLDIDAFAACTSPVSYSGLSDGSHTVTVRAKDAAGNVDASPATRTWTVDATAPDTSIDSGPTGLVSSTSASFDFSSPDGTATFECQLDTDAFAACTSPVTYSDLSDGPHTVTVRAKDAAGNVDPSPATRAWTIDAIGPDTSIDSGPTGLVSSTSASFDFSSPDGTATFECQLDGGGFAPCTSPVSYSDLADGPHTVAVRAKDAAGNLDPSPATRTWSIDATPPDAPIFLTPPNGSTVRSASVNLSGTAEANSTVALFLDGAQVATLTADGAGAWSFTPPALSVGLHVASATATDALGNTGSTSADDTFTFEPVDTTIVSGPAVLATTGEATFAFDSNVSGPTFECSLDGAPFAACSNPVTFTGLVDGAHLLAARADDGAGHLDATPATWSWSVKAHVPAAPLIVRPAQDEVVGTATPLFVGTAEANSTVEVVVDGTSIGNAPVDPQGDWSLLAPAPLAEGQHAVVAAATDEAGQTGPTSATTVFTVDLSVLDTFIVSGPSGVVSTDSASFDFASNLAPVTFECALDGAAFADCANPATFISLAEGTHTLEVRAKDGDGEVDATPATQSWTVDTAGLPAPVITQPSEGASVATRTPVLEGTSALGTTVAVQVDGLDVGSALTDATGHWRLPLFSTLPDGANTAQATASDAFGRVSPPSAVVHFTVDITALDTFIVSGPPALVSSDSATFTFDASVLGATFQCSLDGAPFAACSSPETFSGLGQGAHTLAVAAVDGLGNTDASPALWSWTVDSVAPAAPTITAPTDGSVVGTDVPVVSGTAEPGAWVTVTVDGVVVGTVQANEDGEWILPPSAPLPDGPHEVTATSTDAAGNESGDSAPVGFVVDTVAPTASVLSGPQTLGNSTSASFDLDADELSVDFECSLDGASFVSCTDPAVFSALAEGPHTFQVRATDLAGNTGPASATYSWTVDLTPPTVTLAGGPTGLTNADAASFTLSADEDVSGFECNLDGAGFSACTATVSLTGLAEGSHTLQARATDLAGNTGPATSRTWTVDTTPPTVSIAGGPTGVTNATDATFTLSADEGVSGYECDLDGAGFTACTSDVSLTGLAEGDHTLQARATDLAGNTGAATSRTWTVDTTPPTVSIAGGPTGATSATDAAFTLSADEDVSGYECDLDGAGFAPCTASVSLTGLADGTHTLQVRATDLAGNTGTATSRTWTVDASAPAAPVILTPPDGSTVRAASVTLSGTAEAGSTVALFLDGTQIATLTADGAGTWSFSPASLAVGAHTATATATDALGNESPSSAPDAFTFDPIDTTIVSGPPSLSDSSEATFSFSSNVASATFECSLDGAPFAVCANPVTFTDLVDGAHLLAVRADDGVGDLDPSPASQSWTVRAHVPAAPLVLRPAQGEVVGTATPLILGTAEANSTVSVVIDGTLGGTAPADVNGDWSLLTPTPLSEGSHVVSASAQDAAGHTGPFSAPNTFTVDLTELDTFIVSGPTGLVSVTDATFDLDSSRSPVTYECALDGEAFAACSDPVSFSSLADGTHRLEARAKEASGDVDTTPAIREWTVTTTPPLAAPVVTQPADGASVSTHTPTVEGTSALGTTVTVRVDGTEVGSAVTDANGHWSLALTTPLTTGSHTVDATAQDASSRVSPASATNQFTVDPTALDTFILSGPPPVVSSATATFSFDASVLGATYRCSLDGATYAACANPVTFSGLAEGLHQLSVAAENGLGDVDPSPAGWTWTVDTVAPAAPSITLPVDGSTLLFATPTIEGTAEPGAWVTVSVDGVVQGTLQADASGAWLLPPSVALADGEHVATATATDAAGNVSPVSAPDTFSVLTAELPAPVITGPANGTTINSGAPTVEGTGEPGSTVTVLIDGAPVGTAVVGSDGTWTLVPPQAIPDGTHVITATAGDPPGRTSDASTPISVTVDTAAPDTGITGAPPATTQETTADLALTSTEEGATFECRLDGAAFAPCAAAVHLDPVTQGDHVFEARATDAAGNVDPTPAHVEWTVYEPLVAEPTLNFLGGGCSTTPGGGATTLVLVLLAWLLAGWRRRQVPARGLVAAAGLGLLLMPAAGWAQAQAVPGFDLGASRFELGSDHNLVFNTGELLPQGQYRAGLALELATRPLVLAVDAENKGAVVGSRIAADLFGAYGLTDWLELGVALPVVLHQGGDDLTAYGVSAPSAAGVGTPWLRARAGLLTQGETMPLDLSAAVGVGLPIGSKSALAGGSGLGVDLSVGAGRRLNGWLRAGGELGMLLRPSVSLGNAEPPDAVGSLFRVGAQLSTVNSGLRGEVDLRLDVPVTHAPASAELLFGARLPVSPRAEVFAIAGPGIGHTPGTPAFRALLGVALLPAPAPAPAPTPVPKVVAPVCAPGTPHRAADCPDLDDDSDHVLNKVDACPTQAEDADGYLDADGCPDPDNDGDGVLDEKDACPKEAGPSDHQGCAVKDADQDGIEDADDQCPKEPGDKVHQGCPAPVDTDGDGVADAEDNCVKVAGSKTNQGCPEKQKQLVVIRKEELKILDKVYFSVGGARLKRRSFRLLNQVADVLKGHPDLPVLEVQGHTDSTGKPANNLRLSQRRADAVRAYLIKRGIPAERLSAKGYGQDRPVESNDTAAGREANRRVEFRFMPAADAP